MRRRPSEKILSTSESIGYRDRIVLVTGGNSGIGRAFVERFVAEGASVVACGRNEATLQALKAAHPSVEARRCDVASISEVDALAEFVARQYGRLDVLVSNAGVMEQVNMLSGDVNAAAITREIAINLTAPILLVRRCLPLLQQGRRPLIVMVTSGYALLPARRAPTYSATKAGLRAFTQALRYQLQDSGIRVIETLPPLVDTPSTAGIERAEDGTQSSGGRNLGVHRTGTRRVLRRAGSVAAVIDATGAAFRRTPDSQDLKRHRRSDEG